MNPYERVALFAVVVSNLLGSIAVLRLLVRVHRLEQEADR